MPVHTQYSVNYQNVARAALFDSSGVLQLARNEPLIYAALDR